MKARAASRGAAAQRGAAASDPHVAAAAEGALAQGNAVDAVVTGVLVAAARSPAVLLGPLQALVGGAGAGLLAVDGRVRQPGAGAPRPRGFVAPGEVPDSARAGVPGLPAAVSALMAAVGAASLQRVVGPAVEEARGKSPDRARVLQAFARRGALAFAEGFVADELTVAAGRPAQGVLTKDDLAAARPVVQRCEADTLPGGLLTAPWRTPGHVDARRCHAVMAFDGKGMAAVACYEAPDASLAVAALGLALPLAAEPVLRGKTRVRPGEPRPAAAPIGLRTVGGIVDLCVAVGQHEDAEGLLDGVLAAIVRGTPLTEALGAVRDGSPAALQRVGDFIRSI
jgi:hypothetical protein